MLRQKETIPLDEAGKSITISSETGTMMLLTILMTTEKEKVDNQMANENTGINWAKVAVRDGHGSVDAAATMARLEEELTKHVAENEIDLGEIAGAVSRVLTDLTKNGQAQKASMNLNDLSLRALNLLGSTESRLQKRILEFARGESERFMSSKGADGLLLIRKGKLGGVHVSTPTFVKEYNESLAKKAEKAASAQ